MVMVAVFKVPEKSTCKRDTNFSFFLGVDSVVLCGLHGGE